MKENQFLIQDAFQILGKSPIVIQLDQELRYPTKIVRYVAKIGHEEYPFSLNHIPCWLTLKSESGFGDISRFVGQTVELM